jgi:hypothetical protein
MSGFAVRQAAPGSIARLQRSGSGRFYNRIVLSITASLAVLSYRGVLGGGALAQSVLFDFDNAPVHSPLPLSLTVGGVTAHFSATGQGFSIQAANVLGFTPVGFSGACIYPSSVFAADLIIDFDSPLTSFSILYAPEEYACDSSATMKATAYTAGAVVGSSTTNANAGTWPSETLAFSSAQSFDQVVIHYQAPPVTGGDWGPIFMADNMIVTPAPPPIVLTNVMKLPNGNLAFDFTGTIGGSYTVLTAASPEVPIGQWTSLGPPVESVPGQFHFEDAITGGISGRFYQVRSP